MMTGNAHVAEMELTPERERDVRDGAERCRAGATLHIERGCVCAMNERANPRAYRYSHIIHSSD